MISEQGNIEQSGISAVVVTWNNRASLKKCLACLDDAKSCTKKAVEVIVVDNGSTDGTSDYLKACPGLMHFRFGHNAGFGPASNKGIAMAKAPLVLLLNDDIEIDRMAIDPMAKHFSRPEVFAVAPLMLLNGKPLPGRSIGVFRQGMLGIEVKNDYPGQPSATLFAGGGAGMFRRKAILNLGGFDELYHPFYYEDLDLGYRAWKRGYICISEPASIVHHLHAGTIGKRFSKEYVYSISRRNLILFHWKNIHDRQWSRQHVFQLLRSILVSGLGLKPGNLIAFARALVRLPEATKIRLQEKNLSKMGDREVLDMVWNNRIWSTHVPK